MKKKKKKKAEEEVKTTDFFFFLKSPLGFAFHLFGLRSKQMLHRKNLTSPLNFFHVSLKIFFLSKPGKKQYAIFLQVIFAFLYVGFNSTSVSKHQCFVLIYV